MSIEDINAQLREGDEAVGNTMHHLLLGRTACGSAQASLAAMEAACEEPFGQAHEMIEASRLAALEHLGNAGQEVQNSAQTAESASGVLHGALDGSRREGADTTLSLAAAWPEAIRETDGPLVGARTALEAMTVMNMGAQIAEVRGHVNEADTQLRGHYNYGGMVQQGIANIIAGN